jgi:hypothetical protein
MSLLNKSLPARLASLAVGLGLVSSAVLLSHVSRAQEAAPVSAPPATTSTMIGAHGALIGGHSDLPISVVVKPSVAAALGAQQASVLPVVVKQTSISGSPVAPRQQTEADADRKSAGCLSCHTKTDAPSMHSNPGVVLGCTDCHGGNASVSASGQKADDPGYRTALEAAHILPSDPQAWHSKGSANPEDSFALLNRESAAFVRFINPGDLRVARDSCGACHLSIIQASERSLMATGAMLFGGASYNNGILPYKRYILGESYAIGPDGTSVGAAISNPIKPNDFMTFKGILPSLAPVPAWETVPPADIFRVFERGGRVISSQFSEIGLPNLSGELQTLDEPGRPDIRQSNRGPGTGSRIAVPVINLTKTRLNDPHLWFLGTNEQPGDYRSSGCTACHVVYANDRDPTHSFGYAKFGNTGETQTIDPTIPKGESGHPLTHSFTRSIPSSQCMVCHMHQPNIFVNSFYGYTMWDYESDAPAMWPKEQKYMSDAEKRAHLNRNPEEASLHGNWSDPDFLIHVSELNPTLHDTQFADYHGHGWNFRAIFKRDRHGTLLDAKGNQVDDQDPAKFQKAVHLTSIHLDMGFACVDCHFAQDTHGNGHIYGEVAAAIEIDCRDCHGTATKYPNLRTSGPAAPPGGTDLSLLRTQDGRRRFEWRNGHLYQRSALDPTKEWDVSLVKDTVTPGNPRYNEKAARAKLMAAGAEGRAGQWGPGVAAFAHDDSKMTCFTCHLSWSTSCSGCHLPIQANWKSSRLHYEGGETRNYATYNPQVVRDDVFQLGIHGPVKGSRITPIRSSSALILSSTNINREHIYIQQPPIAASGFSSQAFAPHYPHTERKEETKTCSDCHVSAADDNNAIMAQLLLQGTNFVNFVGFDSWLGETDHIEAVEVTEWDEPQAVIGSYLQRYAYPDFYAKHLAHNRELQNAYDHGTGGEAHCVQLRGEYLYVAEGSGGMRVYDVASIGNKGVSQRIISSPDSPLGQDTHIGSANATCVALPTNQSIAPLRNQGDLMRVTNEEQPFAAIYHYAFISDAVEGLIVTNVDTLSDGEPRNNFLSRAATWNPDGVLTGARHIAVAGDTAYISTPRGVASVSIADPLHPVLLAVIPIADARAAAVQFRFMFVTSASGLDVVDVTHPDHPVLVPSAHLAMKDARKVYVARTYAYVAAGAEGLAIVDVEKPRQPHLLMDFTADGQLNDATDVIVGSTNASLFAYVADGVNGLKVVQLTAPDTQPKFYGFSPEPKPQLIAWRKTASPALSLSKGLDRDRGVDESGHQIAIFGRLGSRPFNEAEMKHMYMNPDGTVFSVTDQVSSSDYVAAPTKNSPPAAKAKS